MALRTNAIFSVTSALLVASALVACGDDSSGTGGAGGGEDTTTAGTTSSTTASGNPTSSSSGGEGGQGGEGGAPPAGTIYEVASSLPDYSSLVAAVDKAGLAAALQDEDATLTVFAPDNDAFAALLEGIGAASLDDVTAEQLRPILLYHVLGSVVDSTAATAAATNEDKVAGLGGSIQFALDGESIELDGRALIETADVPASNGIIHGIDGVILPSITDVAVSDPAFASLATALTVADSDASEPGLVAALDDDAAALTVFAPPNDAFEALVSALSAGNTGISDLSDFAPYQLIPVLKYHVAGFAATADEFSAGPAATLGGTVNVTLAGGGVQVDGVSVTVANILTSNGVIHVIDGVLIPSITDLAVTAPELSSLAATILAADGAAGTSPKVSVAMDASAGVGAYTLFAPSNDAFAALGAAPSGQALTNVLLYHVVNAAVPVFAADALGLDAPTAFDTLLGTQAASEIIVSATGGPPADTVEIDDAGSAETTTVIGANYFTSNGVVHVIDKVLLPGG